MFNKKYYQAKSLWIRLLFLVPIGLTLFGVTVLSTTNAYGEQTAAVEIFLPAITSPVSLVEQGVFYLSPNGNDGASGTTPNEAWRTFDRAWNDLYPGDTLILLDGVYYQSLAPNQRNGDPGQPITIKAQNDGQAIIDGQNQRVTVSLGWSLNGWHVGSNFVVEGIIARNSSESVYRIQGDNNIFRRVSGYDGNTDLNSHIFEIAFGSNNLVEDCVASGTARKMIMVFGVEAVDNVVRRCFSYWHDWRGLNECHGHWPWGDGVQVYDANDAIIENTISMGSVPMWQMSIQNQDPNAITYNNKILGSMMINAGVNMDNSLRYWGPGQVDPVSSPNSSCGLWTSQWFSMRAGLTFYGTTLANVLIQDVFISNNAGVGISTFPVNSVSGIIRNATVINNGSDAPEGENTNLHPDKKSLSIQNSNIPGHTVNGSGARLQYRYINGVLMDGSNGQPAQALWPWPMQDRIMAELGIDVTGKLTTMLNNANVPTGYSSPNQDTAAPNVNQPINFDNGIHPFISPKGKGKNGGFTPIF